MPRDTIIDAATSGGAVTLPFWIESINAVAQELVLLGGVILLALRIALAFRACRRRSADPPTGSDTLDTGGKP